MFKTIEEEIQANKLMEMLKAQIKHHKISSWEELCNVMEAYDFSEFVANMIDVVGYYEGSD